MNDLEKVIKGLKCCELIHRGGLLEESCNLCPYQQNKNQTCEAYELLFDARQHLKEQEPRVLTLDEFMAHWKLPPKERPPIWEEWKIDKGKGSWKFYGRSTGGYGTQWRCWSAKPTDEQREAVPWKT